MNWTVLAEGLFLLFCSCAIRSRETPTVWECTLAFGIMCDYFGSAWICVPGYLFSQGLQHWKALIPSCSDVLLSKIVSYVFALYISVDHWILTCCCTLCCLHGQRARGRKSSQVQPARPCSLHSLVESKLALLYWPYSCLYSLCPHMTVWGSFWVHAGVWNAVVWHKPALNLG